MRMLIALAAVMLAALPYGHVEHAGHQSTEGNRRAQLHDQREERRRQAS